MGFLLIETDFVVDFCFGENGHLSWGYGVLNQLRVVTTTTIITDLANCIGGDYLEIVGLIQPGDDPHVYEPVPTDSVSGIGLMREGRVKERRGFIRVRTFIPFHYSPLLSGTPKQITIESADVIVYNGFDLEMNLMPLIRTAMDGCKHYAVGESVDPIPSSEFTNTPDPHVWNDAGNAVCMVSDGYLHLSTKRFTQFFTPLAPVFQHVGGGYRKRVCGV